MLEGLLGLFVVLVVMHWLTMIPMAVGSFIVGFRKPNVWTVWLLLLIGLVGGFLTPYVPGTVQGSGGLIYMALPFVVPIIVLLFYAVGLIVRHVTKRIKNNRSIA